MTERRRVKRRTIPFLRGGVLRVGDESHIVTIVDLSPEGAFLASRLSIELEQPLSLQTILPRTGRQVSLPCELVWNNRRFDPATGRPAGVAVRFKHDDDEVREHLALLSEEGLFPSAVTGAVDRYEYRVIELPHLDSEELNRLGRDGWALAQALAEGQGFRLILLRRL